MYNEKLHNLYSLPNIIRMIKSRRMSGSRHVAQMGVEFYVNRISVGKQEGKSSLVKSRYRWINNIKMDLREIGWHGKDVVHNRDQWRAIVNTVMNLQVQ
jgi:hypothetical protein